MALPVTRSHISHQLCTQPSVFHLKSVDMPTTRLKMVTRDVCICPIWVQMLEKIR